MSISNLRLKCSNAMKVMLKMFIKIISKLKLIVWQDMFVFDVLIV